METTRVNVINSSALYAHDRVVERGLAFFEELLRDFHPRNFAIRLWDGSCLDAEPGQYARCTAGSQQLECFSKVLGQHVFAHVLHHSYANELVESSMLLNITIIDHLHVTEMLQTSTADACIRQLGLWLTQRNAEPAYAIVLRRVHQKSAPTATDIEQPLTRTQTQLAACVVQLLFLRTIQIGACRLEIRT